MSESVSPKKKSLMPSSPLRSRLRGAGHALTPIVQIGKEGTTPAVVKQLGQALHDHELVKIKIGGECPEDRFAVADAIAAVPEVQLAQILGRTILAYKHDPEKSRYEGGGKAPPAAARAGGKGSPAGGRGARVGGKGARAAGDRPDRRRQGPGTLRRKSATSAKR